MKLKLHYVFLMMLIAANTVFGQSRNKDYYDGELYFKLENSHSNVVVDFNNAKNKDILEILNRYGVTKIERPFLLLKTPVFDRTYQINFTKVGEIEQLIAELESLSSIQYAEKVPIMRSSYTPNDPDQNLQYALGLINAPQAWDLHKEGAIVAIVDDAVLITHEDLAPQVWVNPNEIPNGIDDDGNGYIDDINGWDASHNDPNPNPPSTATDSDFSHGTHCAGIAAAATDNGKGIASIGFNAKIIAVKGKPDDHTGPAIPDVWAGFTYAMNTPADVISCSWGGSGPSSTHQNLINLAYERGKLVIAAAGNGGDDGVGDIEPHYPAAYNHVMAVANTNSSDIKNNSSNYGDWVDISAPGTSIYSTLAGSNSSYGNLTGTSMSTPMVAGLAALIKSANPSLTVDEIENCIYSTAVNINDLNPTFYGYVGAGRIRADSAVYCAISRPPVVRIATNLDSNLICPGHIVQFKDESYLQPSSWNWTFEGGTPATSSEKNPSVLYSTPGTYKVTLEATNAYGVTEKSFSSYIVVENSVYNDMFFDDFETGSLEQWEVRNPSGTTKWKTKGITGVNKYGNRALYIDNIQNTLGARDQIVTKPINLYGRSSVKLEMAFAYRANIAGGRDSLLIKASTDGGVTFPHILFAAQENGSYTLGTYIGLSGAFIPTAENDWCGLGAVGAECMSIDLSDYAGSPDFRIMIENVSELGNNLYVDNFKVLALCLDPSVNPYADFKANQTMACDSLITTFSDESIGNVDSLKWTFIGGEPATSTENSPQVKFPTAGSYNVTLEVFKGNDSYTTMKENYIQVASNVPTAAFSFDQLVNNITTVNTSTNANTYTWEFGNGAESNNENPVYTYDPADEDYTITLIAHNGCGTDTITQTVTTTPVFEPFGENTLLNIFPNPNTGQFVLMVEGKSNSVAKVKIYDILGRNTYQASEYIASEKWTHSISLQNAPKGTYLMAVEIDGHTSYNKVVVK